MDVVSSIICVINGGTPWSPGRIAMLVAAGLLLSGLIIGALLVMVGRTRKHRRMLVGGVITLAVSYVLLLLGLVGMIILDTLA